MSAPPSLMPASTPPFWQPLLGMPQLAPLKYFAKLVRFALRTTPLWYLSALLALVSIGMEMLAMASLFPLTGLAAGQPLAEDGKLIQALRFLGITPDVPTLLKLFLALFSLRYLTQLANMGLSLYLSKLMVAQISHRAFDVFIKDFTLRELEEKSIGYFIALAGDEANRASTVMASLNMFFSQALLALMYFMAIVYYSPPMALAVAAFLLVSFLSMIGVFRQTHRLGIRMVEQSRASGSLFIDALNGLRMVRAFSGEALFSRRYQELIGSYLMTQFKGEFLGVVSRTVPVLFLLGAFFALAALTPQRLTSGVSFAFIITVILFLMRFFPTVGQCLNTFMRILSETKVGQDVTHVIERAPTHAAEPPAPMPPVRTIALEKVGFAYGGRHPVLAGVSFTFERGRSYAIAGPSGSGKSTLLDLLLRFHDLDEGAIRIDGTPIEAIDVRSLRRRVLLLGQETAIFNDTVFNNVAFGEPATQDEVEQACRLACIDQDIRALPQGYQTPLSYRGSNLSGGQRQRIGIARALLRGADVLILDESTSALDQVTRSAVVDNILRAGRDRIVIFVTHDPYLIDKADVCFDLPTFNQASPSPAPGATERPAKSTTADDPA